MTENQRKLRVGVIFGGRSGEHEISLLSASSVMAAIDQSKYDVVPIGITKEGRWLISGDPMLALTSGATVGPSAALLPDSSEHALVALEPPEGGREQRVDVVIPMLHGPFGEDGTVQGLLELANVPYVGSGVLGSALGMDKDVQKLVYRAHGLPTVDFLAIKSADWRGNAESVAAKIERDLGYPCFVKPCNLGSSVGISKVHDSGELAAAMELACSYDRKIVVEKSVERCREIECAVLGNDHPEASVLGEIVPKREFYDYDAKYADQTTELYIPADLAEATAQRIRQMAVTAFLAVDCAGLARVDFLVSRDAQAVYVNEVNTIPGFTQISMYPKLWEASGLSYPRLIDRLIQLAIERHAEKSKLRTSYR